jgi:hypothetical protein
MYDPYDDIRRAKDFYRNSYDEISRMAGAASLAQEDMLRNLKYGNQVAVAADAYLRDSFNLIEQIKLASGAASDKFQNIGRPEILLRADEMLARIKLGLDVQMQLPEQLAELKYAVDARASQFDKFEMLAKSYSSAADLQSKVSSQFAINFSAGALEPLFLAQSNWARTARVSFSAEEFSKFSFAAGSIFDHLAEISASLLVFGGIEEAEQEAEDQAIQIANDRLASAFAERHPLGTMRLFTALLSQIKSGAIRLGPKALYCLMTIVLAVIGNLTTDLVKINLLNNGMKAPHVTKVIREGVRKLQKEGVLVPGYARVVIVDELLVRSGPSQKNPAIGRLFAGDLVCLIDRRNRSWSLIEFKDRDDEVVLRGWVFSRYVIHLRGRLNRSSTAN